MNILLPRRFESRHQLPNPLSFAGRFLLRSAYFLAVTIFFIVAGLPALSEEWFLIEGNQNTSDKTSHIRSIYTEINTSAIHEAVIDSNKGIFFRLRVGAILKDGRSGIAVHDDDELIRDCVRNATWHIKTRRWTNDWNEVGDYLCDLTLRIGNKWGTSSFSIKTEND